MKRSLRILVLSIAGSLLPNVLLAENVSVSVPNVSLLALNTDQILQAKNGGITSIFNSSKPKSSRTIKKNNTIKTEKTKTFPKTTSEKKETLTIKKTLEEFKSLKNLTLPHMVKAWGYNRKTDRIRLANEVGIKNYQGTMKQNSLIKIFLLNKIEITDRKIPQSLQKIEVDTQLAKTIKQLPIHKTVKYRGYIWEIDREKIANELGIKQYKGSREQNLLIKKYFQEKIIEKKGKKTRNKQ